MNVTLEHRQPFMPPLVSVAVKQYVLLCHQLGVSVSTCMFFNICIFGDENLSRLKIF